jgi:hypothetical protein
VIVGVVSVVFMLLTVGATGGIAGGTELFGPIVTLFRIVYPLIFTGGIVFSL